MEFKPHRYQQYAISRVIDTPKLALWLDMGLGKTVSTLTAINDLIYNRFAVRRVLVVAPKKVAEATWQDEAQKWDHLKHLRFSTVLGTERQRMAALYRAADVYVINRDNVQWLVDVLGNEWFFDMVVLDEASSFKNHQSKRFRKLKTVLSRISRLVELTGTPAPRDLMDLWAQIYLLDQGQRLGKTISAYREQWFSPDKRNRSTIFSYKADDGAEEAIKQRLSDICISMKAEDYLELPDCIVRDVPVVLDNSAQKWYDEMEKKMVLELMGQVIDAGTAAVLRMKLLQVAAGAVYDEDRRVAKVHDCKLEAFMELIESLNGKHALVFYAYKHDRDRIMEALKREKVNAREFKGSEDQEAWNNGQVDVLLAHPASCAYGLNLQRGGHNIVWFGLTDSLELYQQANARLHRQGQGHPVIVHRLLVKGTVDEDVAAGLEAKDQCQEMLLQAMKARIDKWRGEVM